jgi:hypothetical protein
MLPKHQAYISLRSQDGSLWIKQADIMYFNRALRVLQRLP